MLSGDELRQLNGINGDTKTICASGVCQLYLASANKRGDRTDPEFIGNQFPKLNATPAGTWVYTRVAGAVVLVVDRELDTFLFQIFDVSTPGRFVLRFQQELYYGMEYVELNPTFYCFEIEDCVAGFNFSDAQVASSFRSRVISLQPKLERNGTDGGQIESSTVLEEKEKQRPSSNPFTAFFRQQAEPPPVPHSPNAPPPVKLRKRDYLYKLIGKSTGGPVKGKEIGTATNVVRHSHIGLNPDGTFDISNIPPEWKHMFKEAGIRKKDLQDPNMSKQIHSALQSAGLAPKNKMISRSYSKRLGGFDIRDDGEDTLELKEPGQAPIVVCNAHVIEYETKIDPEQIVSVRNPKKDLPVSGHEKSIVESTKLEQAAEEPGYPVDYSVARSRVVNKKRNALSRNAEQNHHSIALAAGTVVDVPSRRYKSEAIKLTSNKKEEKEKKEKRKEKAKSSPRREPLELEKKETKEKKQKKHNSSSSPPSSPRRGSKEPELPAVPADVSTKKKKKKKEKEELQGKRISKSKNDEPSPPAPPASSFLDEIKAGQFKMRKVPAKEPEIKKEEGKKPQPSFLNDIQKGNVKLRKVEPPAKEPVKTQAPRPAFLSQIEKGLVTLRSVSEVRALPELKEVGEEKQHTLLDKLKLCVVERRQKIVDEESDGSDGDDWSDDDF